MFAKILGICCGALLIASTAQAAEVVFKARSRNGSDVTFFSDGMAYLSNPAMRWSARGRWKKEGRKYCADWGDPHWPRQCYW